MASAAPLRLLLVKGNGTWRRVAAVAAARLGATFDQAESIDAAIAALLHGGAVYSHVLVSDGLPAPAREALGALLDEAGLGARLVRLGGGSGGVDRCAAPNPAVLVRALRARRAPALPPMEEAEMTASVHAGSVRMRFQPILRAGDLRPVGVEALARVNHAMRGFLHPRDFLPLACGQAQERALVGFAARRLCLEVRRGVLDPSLMLTVNLPISLLLHRPAVASGVRLCAMAGLSPARVVLEVLETAAVPDLAALGRAMGWWRAAGFHLAMDDAGPALPYWRRLMDLPFDTVKLDGAMVAEPSADALTGRVVEEARRRSMFVVAEGIETRARLARMREFGVDAVQGFLFARPLPALALPVWLDRQAERPQAA